MPSTNHQRWRRARRLLRALPLIALVLLSANLLPAVQAAPLAARDGAWSPGPGASGNNTFLGFIDVPADGASVPVGTAFNVSGWLVDQASADSPGISGIELRLGGADGSLIGAGTVGGARPDVGTAFNNPRWNAAGWTVSVPASALAQGTQTLTLAARTPSRGTWLKSFSLTIGAPAVPTAAPSPTMPTFAGQPEGELLSPRDGQLYRDDDVVGSQIEVTGWAVDRNATPDQGTGIDQVRLSVDGKGYGTATLGQSHGNGAQYGPQFAHAGFEGTINANTVGNGHHILTVTVHSAVSGHDREFTVGFNVRIGCDVNRNNENDDDKDKTDKDKLPDGC